MSRIFIIIALIYLAELETPYRQWLSPYKEVIIIEQWLLLV